MAHLVLVRHGRSKWNDKGLWTGWRNISLNNEGRKEAARTSIAIMDIEFHIAFTSRLIRARQTLDIILQKLQLEHIPIKKHQALNEKHYGDFTGKNKWQIKELVGEEEFQKIRRSWDYVIPNGESLKMVYERVVAYYQENIHPHLMGNKNVLIAAHGNSLRALIKYLENIPDEQIAEVEIRTGEAYVYTLDQRGRVKSKQIRAENSKEV